MNADHSMIRSTMRVLLVALFSDTHPAVGESHGVSVLGGCLEDIPSLNLDMLRVIDMYSSESGNRESDLLKSIEILSPTVLATSVPYGSYTFLRNIYPRIKKLLEGREYLVIFGGALPTYLPDAFLRDIDVSAIVVQGEGDEALVQILQAWQDYSSFEPIPNICYVDERGRTKSNEKKLVDVKKIPPPHRSHLNMLVTKKAQIFTESSRGCSWAACTFCPRGLVDVKGTGDEYRRFPIDRLSNDLIKLNSFNIQAFTFADEDLLGGTIDECEDFVKNLGKSASC